MHSPQTKMNYFAFQDNKLSNCLLSNVDALQNMLIQVTVHLLTMKISMRESLQLL